MSRWIADIVVCLAFYFVYHKFYIKYCKQQWIEEISRKVEQQLKEIKMESRNGWISKTERQQNEVFMCPLCKKEVRYTDGLAKKRNNPRIAKCEYRFCPWCGLYINDEPQVQE